MSGDVEVRRYAAFSAHPDGGNPAGVVLDGVGLSAARMQGIAAAVGYSETAFVLGEAGGDDLPVRYFAPEGEVDFCGHATIATAAALAERFGPGERRIVTAVGPVTIRSARGPDGLRGSLLSPPIGCEPIEPGPLRALLSALRWGEEHLDPELGPAIGSGGNRHPVLVLRDLGTLAGLDYDFAALQELCRAHRWITVQLVARAGDGTWRARDPFPWGGVVEDPATGAAAAAFAGYLRAAGLAADGDTFTIHQGVEMGRPSAIDVEVVGDRALVSGYAAPLAA